MKVGLQVEATYEQTGAVLVFSSADKLVQLEDESEDPQLLREVGMGPGDQVSRLSAHN